MSEPKQNESASKKKNANFAASNGRRAMTIDISGKAPGVSRRELRQWIRTVFHHLEQQALSFCLGSLIGGDNVLYETMTNNILFAEKDEFDVINVSKNLLRFF